MSNMKPYYSQQCSIACSSVIQSELPQVSENAVGWILVALWETWKEENGSMWENEMKKTVEMDAMSAVLLSFSVSLVIPCVCINSAALKGGQIWQLQGWCFWLVYQPNALWQSCDMRLLDQKAFCFLFISHTLSQDSIDWVEEKKKPKRGRSTEGARNRRINRPDDRRADRQVEKQPADLEFGLKYLTCSSTRELLSSSYKSS